MRIGFLGYLEPCNWILHGGGGRIALFEAERALAEIAEHRPTVDLLVVSLHADLLKERHTTSPLGDLLPFDQFAEADLLLYLRGELQHDENTIGNWIARSGPVMGNQAPRYFSEAKQHSYAQQVMIGLGLDDIEVLRRRLAAKKGTIAERLGHPSGDGGPLEFFDPADIGTR